MFSSQNSQVSNAANYIEDVFSTYLYTGNGATQTITNGIDLSTKGGLVWAKDRTQATDHQLSDSAIGPTRSLSSSLTLGAGNVGSTDITGFTSSGFTLGYIDGRANSPGSKVASWTFRKQPKFFDVVTYTGDGTSSKTIAHNLGSAPGCIIIKALSGTYNWAVYHRGLSDPTGKAIYLDLTNAESASDSRQWNNTAPTSTNFTVGTFWNTNNVQFVAYLFAHDAGGFGTAGTDNVISCGSFTTNGSGNATVNLGYEPQWFLAKSSSTTQDWFVVDSMRGWVNGGANDNDALLRPNLSNAEFVTNFGEPTATGFNLTGFTASQTYIYIAIRRGPMKVPTDGTKVFDVQFEGNAANNQKPMTVSTTGVVDMAMRSYRPGSVWTGSLVYSRLQGDVYFNGTASTDAEATGSAQNFAFNNGWFNSNTPSPITSQLDFMFKRAPSFFDVVCYTGDGTLTPINHNLTVVPELIIYKRRNATQDWWVVDYVRDKVGKLNLTDAFTNANTSPNYLVNATTMVRYLNTSGLTYVAYLFATCAGVSKVGSYTGTGTTKQVDCGFAAGARFVLIKKTSGTGSWYVWDSARGIVSGNDPYLLLNSTAAEVTSTDYIDTYAAGFEISSTAPSEINENGGSFIYLAIA